MALESLTWAFRIEWYSIKNKDFNHNPLVTSIGSSMILPSDLLSDPTWPISKLIRDVIKTNIVTNFQEYWTENVGSKAYIR